jgi:L-seryl-tRNA(Ser) seleniumtransferase
VSSPVPAAPFRSLPAADRLLRAPRLAPLLASFSRDAVLWLIRDVLDGYRRELAAGGLAPSFDGVIDRIEAEAARRWALPEPVINATGVILHTNLGRAPLSEEALAAMRQAAAYSDLELDLGSGERGSRQERVAGLLCTLTGAEAAHVTGNNAAAVLLALAALARGKDVIVSRGQSVEIGGGFRIPVILRQSGARLVEVGTTNRTRLEDYEAALGPRTGALLHVHSSNFRIVGFTEDVPLDRLAALARAHGVPLIVDNGSGALIDTAAFGLAHEPMPREAIAAGADLVAFSGDKLVGGPQAGLLVGRAEHITRMQRHPLARALRPDKLILAALGATLLVYVRDRATTELPIWRMIAQPESALAERAAAWQRAAAVHGIAVEVRAGESTIGGGSLPGEVLPTTLLALPGECRPVSLRRACPPVLARAQAGRVLLDLRTVAAVDDAALLAAVRAVVDKKVQ